MTAPASRIACQLVLACGTLAFGAPAWADAPRDIPGSLRLWLDAQDINGTDTGNAAGSSPAPGSLVTSWKDKSGNGFHAGDAVSFGAISRSYPQVGSTAVSFNGINNVLEIPTGIFGSGSTVTASNVFLVASSRSIKDSWIFAHGAKTGPDANRIGIAVPRADDLVYFNHGTPNGQLTTGFSANSMTTNRPFVMEFSAVAGSSQAFTSDGISLATANNAGTYTQGADHRLLLGSFENIASPMTQFYDGGIYEMIVYARRVNTAERNILLSYLAAKHGNPGGVGAAKRYTVTSGFRYHVGGIGQETDGSVAVGTSVGLTLSNLTFLGNGRYLLAGVDAKNPATGSTTTDAPAGYATRSQRIWYMTRTGGGAGNASVSFNLAQLGLTAANGAAMALLYRTGTTGAFTVLSTATYNGSGSVSFTASSPQSGFYALGLPAATAGSPTLTLSVASMVATNGITVTNPKATPGALLKVSAVATNTGTGSPDANSTTLTLPIPANTRFFLGDMGPAGSGPVQFTQGSTASGLTYSWVGFSSTTDSLEFSSNSGSTWTYVPMPNAQQTDAAITNVRVKPSGTFATGTAPNLPSFTVTYGVVVN